MAKLLIAAQSPNAEIAPQQSGAIQCVTQLLLLHGFFTIYHPVDAKLVSEHSKTLCP